MQLNKRLGSNFEFSASFSKEAEQTRNRVVNTITRAFSLFDRQDINRDVEIESIADADNSGYYYWIVVSKSLQAKIELKKKAIDELPGIERIKLFLDLRSDDDGDVYETNEYYDSEGKSVVGMYSEKQNKYVDSLDSDEHKLLLGKYLQIATAYRYCRIKG